MNFGGGSGGCCKNAVLVIRLHPGFFRLTIQVGFAWSIFLDFCSDFGPDTIGIN